MATRLSVLFAVFVFIGVAAFAQLEESPFPADLCPVDCPTGANKQDPEFQAVLDQLCQPLPADVCADKQDASLQTCPGSPILTSAPCNNPGMIATVQGSMGMCTGGFVVTGSGEFCLTSSCPADDIAVYRGPNQGCNCPDGSTPKVGLYGKLAGQYTICPNSFAWFVGAAEIGYCYICKAKGPGGNGDPHFVGFDGTQYDVQGKDGLVYNLVSEREHVVNARFGNVGDVKVASLWMKEFGFVYKNSSVSVKLSLDTYKPRYNYSYEDASRMNRMVYDNIGEVVQVTVDGEDKQVLLKSDGVLTIADKEVVLYFPAAGHSNDPTDGPILTVRTSKMEATVLLETEGVLHLDFSLRLLSSGVDSMHGLIGQTHSWSAEGGTNSIEGTEDDYIVEELLSTQAKFGVFGSGKARQDTRRVLREMPTLSARTSMF